MGNITLLGHDLSELLTSVDGKANEELCFLAQMLRDLKLDTFKALMQRLDVVFVRHDDSDLIGKFYYNYMEGQRPENCKPYQSDRRKAILAVKQKRKLREERKKNEAAGAF